MKNKMVNKNLKYIMGLIFTLVCMVYVCITVYAANVNVSIDSQTVVKGGNVTINVTFSTTSTIGGYDAYVQYDSSKLEFTGGSVSGGGVVTGGNGRIRIYDDSTPSANVNASLNFVAKELGSHNVYITADSSFYDNNVDDMNLVVESTGVVNVTSAPEVVASSDSTLKELNVFAVKEDGSSSQVWFWPNFSGATTNYSLNVDKNVTKLMVTAKANHASATVAVSDTNLNIGNNNINVVVTAEDGSKTTYTIATNRSNEEPSSEEETSTVDGENREKTVSIGGTVYNIVDFTADSDIPEGYEIVDFEYKGSTIKAIKGLGTNIVVFGLSSKEGEVEKYIYDSNENVFYKFNMFNLKASQFVFMDMPEDISSIKLPSSFKLLSITVNGNVIDAYGVEQGDNYIVYAMDCNGNKGFYYLNIKNNTLTEYFDISYEEETTIYSKDQQESNSKEIDELKKEKKIILIISIIVILALVSVILMMLLSKKNTSEDDEDDDEEDDNDEDDFDELEITANEAINDEKSKEEAERNLYETDELVEPEYEEETLSENIENTENVYNSENDNKTLIDNSENDDKTVIDNPENDNKIMTDSSENVENTENPEYVKEADNTEKSEDLESVENIESSQELEKKERDINKILEDETTSIKADDLDMILDDLLSEIHK